MREGDHVADKGMWERGGRRGGLVGAEGVFHKGPSRVNPNANAPLSPIRALPSIPLLMYGLACLYPG